MINSGASASHAEEMTNSSPHHLSAASIASSSESSTGDLASKPRINSQPDLETGAIPKSISFDKTYEDAEKKGVSRYERFQVLELDFVYKVYILLIDQVEIERVCLGALTNCQSLSNQAVEVEVEVEWDQEDPDEMRISNPFKCRQKTIPMTRVPMTSWPSIKRRPIRLHPVQIK